MCHAKDLGKHSRYFQGEDVQDNREAKTDEEIREKASNWSHPQVDGSCRKCREGKPKGKIG